MFNLFGKRKSLEELEAIVDKYNEEENYKELIDVLYEEKVTDKNKNFVIGQLGRAYNNLANTAEEDDEIIANFKRAEDILRDLIKDPNCKNAGNLYKLAYTTYSYAWRGFEAAHYWQETQNILLEALTLDPKHESTNEVINWVIDEVYENFLQDYSMVFKNTKDSDCINYLSDNQLEAYFYDVLVAQVNNGGFIQLIHNGYGNRIFNSPFIDAMKNWGLVELAELLDQVKGLFLVYKDEILDATDAEAFSELYKKIPQFKPYDEEFHDNEKKNSLKWAVYMLLHPDYFKLSSNSIHKLWHAKDNTITRWKFTDNLLAEEEKVFSKKVIVMDAFWRDFEENLQNITDALQRKNDFDLADYMAKYLSEIDDKIYWEFGPAVNSDGSRLVFYKNDLTRQPLLQEFVKRAPEINEWEFYSHFLPVNEGDSADVAVKTRTGCTITDFEVELFVDKQNVIGLKFYKKAPPTDNDMNAIYIALDHILGESIFSKWVGFIELSETPLSKDSISFTNLKNVFFDTIKEIKALLPELPYHKQEESWSMMKNEPAEQVDYAFQDDIYVIKTVNANLWHAQHSHYNFASERFSKNGEVFCYIKLDGSNLSSDELFKDKGDIEDALDDVLKQNNLGCFIGGGTGYKYSYVDVVLTDLDKGIQLIKETLQKGKISKHAWIMFYDTELRHEWIGIYDDSPKPKVIDIYK